MMECIVKKPTDKLICSSNQNNKSYTFPQDESEKILLHQKSQSQLHPKAPNPWLRKPIWVIEEDESRELLNDVADSTRSLQRHLNLFDLVSIGVGATIGSGVFVLCGLIAHDYAGPATFICWAIAGFSACASGLCYAELSGKFAVAGSSYSYVYISMGELPAVITAACLTLEYLFSASAVARSWGDKIVAYVQNIVDQNTASNTSTASAFSKLALFLDPGYNINPAAFLVSALSILLLLNGVKESKRVANFFTVFKVALVLFMCIAATYLVEPENFHPLIPAKFGIAGVMRGSVSTFFGYIGYDEICCMAGEAVNPKKNLPRAVMVTLLLVTFLYVLAAVALVGMVPYDYISITSGFPDGFHWRGVEWASQVTALGELITLPIVVLVTIMAQPRLQYAMSSDGLLPPIFAQVDDSGNLWWGTLVAGSVCVIIATCVPFTYLNDLISAGILLAFNMTDASVIILRQTDQASQPYLLGKLLFLFNVLSFTMGLLLKILSTTVVVGKCIAVCNFFALVYITHLIALRCPGRSNNLDQDFFEVPFMPYLPLLGQFLNCYLIGQLEIEGLLLLVGYIGLAVILYFKYGFHHSFGNTVGWYRSEQEEGSEKSVDIYSAEKRDSSLISMHVYVDCDHERD